MKLKFVSIGKPHESYVKIGVEEFTKRITHYYPVDWHIIPMPKNSGTLTEAELRRKEGEVFLEWLSKDDFLVALDERGKQLDSESVAGLIEARANLSTKQLVFLIGGAFGLDSAVFKTFGFYLVIIIPRIPTPVGKIDSCRTDIQGLHDHPARKIPSLVNFNDIRLLLR